MARFPTKNLIKPVVVSVADEQAAQALLGALPDPEWLAMMQLCIRNAIELGMLHPRDLMAAAWEADPADALEYIRSRQSEPDEDDD
jgi:hypothetical protein